MGARQCHARAPHGDQSGAGSTETCVKQEWPVVRYRQRRKASETRKLSTPLVSMNLEKGTHNLRDKSMMNKYLLLEVEPFEETCVEILRL